MSSPVPAPGPAGDQELATRAASGDERAIATLYDRYGSVLYAVAYRMMFPDAAPQSPGGWPPPPFGAPYG